MVGCTGQVERASTDLARPVGWPEFFGCPGRAVKPRASGGLRRYASKIDWVGQRKLLALEANQALERWHNMVKACC